MRSTPVGKASSREVQARLATLTDAQLDQLEAAAKRVQDFPALHRIDVQRKLRRVRAERRGRKGDAAIFPAGRGQVGQQCPECGEFVEREQPVRIGWGVTYHGHCYPWND